MGYTQIKESSITKYLHEMLEIYKKSGDRA